MSEEKSNMTADGGNKKENLTANGGNKKENLTANGGSKKSTENGDKPVMHREGPTRAKSARRFIGSVCFVLVAALLFVAANVWFFKPNEKTEASWEKLQTSDEPVDILFMGSSRIYRSVNPLVINEATGLNTMILGSDSQTVVQARDNLQVLISEGKLPKMIVFEPYGCINRNMTRLKEESKGLVLMNIDGVNNIFERIKMSFKELGWRSIPEGAFQLARPTLTWSRLKAGEDWEKNRPDVQGSYDLEGFRPDYHIVKEGSIDMQSFIDRYAEDDKTPKALEEEQEVAFREFLQLAQDNSIEVWVLYTPTVEEKYFKNGWSKEMAEVMRIADEYPCVTYAENLNYDIEEMGLTAEDFHHESHLNARGAAKYTRFFLKQLRARKGIEYDLSKVFYYKDESRVKGVDGTWRYTVENYQPAYYQFVLRKGKTRIKMQEYSEKNYFEVPYSQEQGYTVEYSMLPIDTDLSSSEERAAKHLIANFLIFRTDTDS